MRNNDSPEKPMQGKYPPNPAKKKKEDKNITDFLRDLNCQKKSTGESETREGVRSQEKWIVNYISVKLGGGGEAYNLK